MSLELEILLSATKLLLCQTLFQTQDLKKLMPDEPLCCSGDQEKVIEDDPTPEPNVPEDPDELDFEFNLVSDQEPEESPTVKTEPKDEPKPTEEKISDIKSDESKSSVTEETKKPPDSVSTDSGICTDSGISSGNSDPEVDNPDQLVYEKPKHLNQ